MDTTVYPTREDYARRVWKSLDSATRTGTIARWHEINTYGPVVPFYPWLADNMDVRHNGTVTFTRAVFGRTLSTDKDETRRRRSRPVRGYRATLTSPREERP